jgi:hypothetical protein
VSAFETLMTAELVGLLRAGVPPRGVRLTVRELVIMRLERGPLGAHEVNDAVEAAARAACRLVHELDAPPDVVESVCRGALEAVRGHGGETARWLSVASGALSAVLEAEGGAPGDRPVWPWLLGRVPRW